MPCYDSRDHPGEMSDAYDRACEEITKLRPEGRRPSLALPQEAAADWLEFLSDTEDRRECGCWREEYCE